MSIREFFTFLSNMNAWWLLLFVPIALGLLESPIKAGVFDALKKANERRREGEL